MEIKVGKIGKGGQVVHQYYVKHWALETDRQAIMEVLFRFIVRAQKDSSMAMGIPGSGIMNKKEAEKIISFPPSEASQGRVISPFVFKGRYLNGSQRCDLTVDYQGQGKVEGKGPEFKKFLFSFSNWKEVGRIEIITHQFSPRAA
jgi:hypothetical protein